MEVKTKIEGKVQKELLLPLYVVAWVTTCLGAVGLIVFGVLLGGEETTNAWDAIGYPFAGLLVVGICIFVMHAFKVKSANINKENLYVFNDEFFEIKTIYHGEIEDTGKLYYNDIAKIKETKNYIFIYPTINLAYPVAKANVENLDALRKLLKMKK